MKKIICLLMSMMIFSSCAQFNEGFKKGFEKGYNAAVNPNKSVDAVKAEPDSVAAEKEKFKDNSEAEDVVSSARNSQQNVESVTESKQTLNNNASETMGQKNAVKKARQYLEYSAFSYQGLIGQLEYEKFSNAEAVYGADNCGADWNEQATLCAKNYLDYSSFSYNGLIEQLEYENFTSEQAAYGANNCGADWNEQAVKAAKKYLDYSAFSRDELIAQLEYEGFTNEQAVYGAAQNGY